MIETEEPGGGEVGVSEIAMVKAGDPPVTFTTNGSVAVSAPPADGIRLSVMPRVSV